MNTNVILLVLPRSLFHISADNVVLEGLYHQISSMSRTKQSYINIVQSKVRAYIKSKGLNTGGDTVKFMM